MNTAMAINKGAQTVGRLADEDVGLLMGRLSMGVTGNIVCRSSLRQEVRTDCTIRS